MIELKTLARKSKFSYDGSVRDGLIIYTGEKGYSSKINKETLKELLNFFAGKTITIDTTRTTANLKEGSLGHWLFNRTSIVVTSYVAAILVHEGYAEYVPSKKIRFK